MYFKNKSTLSLLLYSYLVKRYSLCRKLILFIGLLRRDATDYELNKLNYLNTSRSIRMKQLEAMNDTLVDKVNRFIFNYF